MTSLDIVGTHTKVQSNEGIMWWEPLFLHNAMICPVQQENYNYKSVL